MKKLLTIILVMMLPFATALSEEASVHLSSMSLDELIELRSQITDEINARLGFSFEDNQIGAGMYLVGEDITAGKYEFICTASETRTYLSSDETTYIGSMWILSSSDEDAETVFEYGDIPIGQKIMFELEDGQMLVIGRCSGLIAAYSHSWAP